MLHSCLHGTILPENRGDEAASSQKSAACGRKDGLGRENRQPDMRNSRELHRWLDPFISFFVYGPQFGTMGHFGGEVPFAIGKSVKKADGSSKLWRSSGEGKPASKLSRPRAHSTLQVYFFQLLRKPKGQSALGGSLLSLAAAGGSGAAQSYKLSMQLAQVESR
jgi:hypothetical protein